MPDSTSKKQTARKALKPTEYPDLIIINAQLGFLNNSTHWAMDYIENCLTDALFNSIIATRFVTEPDAITGASMMFHSRLNYVRMDTGNTDNNIRQSVGRAAKLIINKDMYGLPETTVRTLKTLHDDQLTTGITPEPITIMGFDTDACVLNTCFQLFNAGIDFVVDLSGCGSSESPAVHSNAVSIMRTVFGADCLIEKTIDTDRETWVNQHIDDKRVEAIVNRILNREPEEYTDPYPEHTGEDYVDVTCTTCNGKGKGCNCNKGVSRKKVKNVRTSERKNIAKRNKLLKQEKKDPTAAALRIEKARLNTEYDTALNAEARIEIANNYVLGDTLKAIPVIVKNIWSGYGRYGPTMNIVFTDIRTGCDLLWMTSSFIAKSLDIGKKYTLTGTIKDISVNNARPSVRLRKVWMHNMEDAYKKNEKKKD